MLQKSKVHGPDSISELFITRLRIGPLHRHYGMFLSPIENFSWPRTYNADLYSAISPLLLVDWQLWSPKIAQAHSRGRWKEKLNWTKRLETKAGPTIVPLCQCLKPFQALVSYIQKGSCSQSHSFHCSVEDERAFTQCHYSINDKRVLCLSVFPLFLTPLSVSFHLFHSLSFFCS